MCEEPDYQYLQKQRPCSLLRAGRGKVGLTEGAGGRSPALQKRQPVGTRLLMACRVSRVSLSVVLTVNYFSQENEKK